MSEQSKIDAERAAFELEVRVQHENPDLSRKADGSYSNFYLQCVWMGWQQRASLPVGVPDGFRAAQVVGFKPGMGEVTLYVGRLPDWLDMGHTCYVSSAPAAPTVKAEQVQCEECGGNGVGGDHEDDCSKAPSLPAAGSVGVGCLAGQVCGGDAEHNTVNVKLDLPAPWYSLRIGTRLHLSAQQSAAAYGSYTTRPAEAVAGIALRQLGDESRWVEIRDLNAHAFPGIGPHDYYPVGTVLRMPAQQQSAPERVSDAAIQVLEKFVRVMPKHGWPKEYDDLRRLEIVADAARTLLASHGRGEA